MADIVKIASYISMRYQQQYGKEIDELKLHKLRYFAQRESIIQTREPLFKDCFEAWQLPDNNRNILNTSFSVSF